MVRARDFVVMDGDALLGPQLVDQFLHRARRHDLVLSARDDVAVDIFDRLLQVAADGGRSVYLLGATAEVLATLQEKLRERLRQQLERKMRTTRHTTQYELKTKLIRYGLSLGYDYETVLDSAAALVTDTETCDEF